MRPAARVLQLLGQIPVVERRPGSDAAFEESVDETIVEVQPLGVRGAPSTGLDARPGQGEAVGVQPEAAQEVEVLGQAVVVIAGHVTVVAVVDGPGRMAERVQIDGVRPSTAAAPSIW